MDHAKNAAAWGYKKAKIPLEKETVEHLKKNGTSHNYNFIVTI